jgi:cell division protein FtsN
MYRVRIGPFEKKDEAESTKEKLSVAGVEAALVRVQK